MFTEKTKKCIIRAGWYEGRVCTMERYFEAIEKKVGHVPQCLGTFMSEFGGLHVKHPHLHIKDQKDNFSIYSDDYMPDQRDLTSFEEKLSMNIYWIGEASNSFVALYMSEDGRVYADIDGELYLVGYSGKDALDALCCNRSWNPLN